MKEIQTALTEAGYPTGGVDGDFGPKTKNALQRFQEKFHLMVDGIFGPKTKEALIKALKVAADGLIAKAIHKGIEHLASSM